MGADAIIIIDLVLVALVLVGSLAFIAADLASDAEPTETEELPDDFLELAMWIGVILSFVVFGVLPLWWFTATRVGGWRGAMVALRVDRFPSAALQGALVGAALAAIVLGLLVLLYYVGVPLPEETDPLQYSWALAIAIAVGAGVGEEIFFRGVLQRWLGVWGQAGLFGLFHVANGGLLPFLITGLIGLLFGWLYKRGASLWLVITAHTVYDVILLGLPLLLPGDV